MAFENRSVIEATGQYSKHLSRVATILCLGAIAISLQMTIGCNFRSASPEQVIGDWISVGLDDGIVRLRFRDDGTVLYRCTATDVSPDGQIVELADPSYRPIGDINIRTPIYVEHLNANWVLQGKQCLLLGSPDREPTSMESWRSGRGMAVFEPGAEIVRVNVLQSDLLETDSGVLFRRDSSPPPEMTIGPPLE